MIQLSIEATIFGVGAGVNIGLIYDDHGNWAIIQGTTICVNSVGGQVSITGGVQWTNANTIWDVINGGIELQVSVTYGEGLAVTGTGIFGDAYEGGGLSAGLGVGLSVEGSVEMNTNVIISNKTFEILGELNAADCIAYGALITGQISRWTYYRYRRCLEIGYNPEMAFLWLLQNINQDNS